MLKNTALKGIRNMNLFELIIHFNSPNLLRRLLMYGSRLCWGGKKFDQIDFLNQISMDRFRHISSRNLIMLSFGCP